MSEKKKKRFKMPHSFVIVFSSHDLDSPGRGICPD